MTENSVSQSFVKAMASLIKLIKAVSLYPSGHPALERQLQLCTALFAPLVVGEGCELIIKKRGIFFSGDQVAPDDTNIGKLSAGLFARRLSKLTLLDQLDPADLFVFVKIIILDPPKIQKLGGVESLLAEAAVSTVWVNDIDPESIVLQMDERRERRAVMLAAAQVEDEGDAQTDLGSSASGTTSSTDGEISNEVKGGKSSSAMVKLSSMLDSLLELDDENSSEEKDTLATLVEEMKNAELSDFSSIMKRVRACFPACFTSEERLSIVPLLSNLIEILQNKEDPRASDVTRTFESIMDNDCIEYLLRQFSDGEVTQEVVATIQSVFVFSGEAVTPAIVKCLIEENNPSVRRRLNEVLVGQGDVALPVLVPLLDDDRWFVVRNIITIIGDIRNSDVVEKIATLLHHNDSRVCREALRSITKIGGDKVVKHLIAHATKGDTEPRRQAILSIGALKFSEAVPHLIDIFRGLGNSPNDFEIKKEILRALSKIASPEAIPLLVELLEQKKFWGGSRQDDIRVLAVTALGNIPSEQSVEILSDFTDDKSIVVARAVAGAIKSLQKGLL